MATFELLQHNWNNRKPYANKRNRLQKSLNCKLHKTEFKLLLNEEQMSECYDPVKLYQINKELMDKSIGTCQVEALTLMISLPKGRKDLTEGIQIIEKIIGPVEYINENNCKNKRQIYSLKRKHKGNEMFNTVDLKLNSKLLNKINNESNLNSISRKRGASLLSQSKTEKIKQKSKTPKVKLSIVCLFVFKIKFVFLL